MFTAANQRRVHGPSVGEATEPSAVRAVRRHGNLAENAAIFIVCVTLLEMLGGGRLLGRDPVRPCSCSRA